MNSDFHAPSVTPPAEEAARLFPTCAVGRMPTRGGIGAVDKARLNSLPAILLVAVLVGLIGLLTMNAQAAPPAPAPAESESPPPVASRFDAQVWLELTARRIMREKANVIFKRQPDAATLQSEMRKLQTSYLHGLDLQIARLTDPLDAAAVKMLRAEIAATLRDAGRFDRLMRGLPVDGPSSSVPETGQTSGATASPDAVGALQLLYKCAEPNAAGNQIKPHFKLVNPGDDAVPLSELTIRYWFTNDGRKELAHWCDYSSVGAANVTATFTKIRRRGGADHYLEIGFTAAAGMLVKDKDVDIQSRSAKTDWTVFDQEKDYSFDPAKTDYAKSTTVTLYRNGTLISGTEPQ